MMPDRIGIIGSTQGVKASRRPKPKKLAMTTNRLPSAISPDRRSCSETMGAAASRGEAVPGGGIVIDTVRVTGG